MLKGVFFVPFYGKKLYHKLVAFQYLSVKIKGNCYIEGSDPMSIERKPSTLEQKLILSPLRIYIQNKYNVKVEQNDTIGLKPPYLVLANHVNNWDPFFINCYVDEPLCFVAAAPLFRNQQLKKVLDYAGTISKTKGRPDRSTIRNILKAKKNNRAIALFPEGNRTWNGETDKIVYSTAKLVKLLGIPVIIGNIKGGYLSQPRWSNNYRKGQISVSLTKLWNGDDLKELSIKEIDKVLNQVLYVDDIAWQQQTGIHFKGKQLAEYLERYLYTCPQCAKIDQMYSVDNKFRCQQCGYSVLYNEAGTFDQYHEKFFFKTIKSWSDWQNSFISEHIQEEPFLKALEETFKNEVKVLVSKNEQPFESQGEYTLSWRKDGIYFEHLFDKKSPIAIPFEQLSGLNVHLSSRLYFFYEDHLYRVDFTDPRTSAYKWFHLISQFKSFDEE